ncbi:MULTISPECIES: DUF2628 domain-containing protein [unclassified Moraxella]|uniref:DUF2628 domain-containing protein n=1 Tax=unclassified Moraxella TaxID=2685852 RepID=UPI003AF53626
MLFIEETSPPPFWQDQLTDKQRLMYDKAYIGNRSQAYYLKRFAQFDKAGKLSAKWHWSGFFMTFAWLLYRKRYLDSIVYSVAGWSFIQVNVTILLVVLEYLVVGNLPEAWRLPIRFGLAGMVWLFWAYMVARWTDAYYYRMARREIADAIEMYPKDEEKQLAHIRQHGGVSLVGMGLAFGFFAFVLMVIQVQFLPIYAKQKANETLFEVYDIVENAQKRVEVIYQMTGQCPVNTPLTTDNQKVRLTVLTQAEGMPNTSPCMVQATVQGVSFPNRWLNGQKLTMYRVDGAKGEGSWGCITSLNRKQTPKQCMVAER